MRNKLFSVILIPLLMLLTGCGKGGLFAVSYESQEPCGFVQNVYGERISWKGKTPIQLNLHESIPSEMIPAIQSAIKVWETALGKPLFQVVQYGAKGPLQPRQDGVNIIYWMNTWESNRTSEQARTSVFWVGNEIREADIRINGKDFSYYVVNSNSAREVHLESLMVHELGHVLGLKHNDLGGSVMATYLSSVTERDAVTTVDLASARCEY